MGPNKPPIEMGRVIFNPDHIVSIDLRREGHAQVHTTLGTYEFDGKTADDIRAYYLPAQPLWPTPEAAAPKPKGKR